MPTNLELVEAQAMSLSQKDRALLLQRLRLSINQVSGESQAHGAHACESGQSWAEEHAEFVTAYTLMVEKEGLALDEWRNF